LRLTEAPFWLEQVLVLSHHVYRLLICGSKEGTKADSGVDLVRDVLMKPVARRKRAVRVSRVRARARARVS